MIESFGLKDSPSRPDAPHKRSDPRNQDKTEKIVKKICFHNDQTAIVKRDGTQFRPKRSYARDLKVTSTYILSQFNSIEISRNNTIIDKLQKPSEIEYEEGHYNETITCKCKKTRCSKMYCECFANGQECSFRCECSGCSNRQRKTPTHQFDYQGCFCKKQDCSKKYCECLKRNLRCTDKCKCSQDCKNFGPKFSPLPFDLNR